jgi:hypothetical protein
MFRVSDLLSMAGCQDPWWFTAEGRQRGTTVHFIGQQVLLQAPCGVGPDYQGYERAIRNGIASLGFVPLSVERRMQHSTRGFHGRPDTCGIVQAKVGRIRKGPGVVDIKSGAPTAAHALQLGFYEMLAEDDSELQAAITAAGFDGYPWTRIGLYVQADGTYRIEPYDNFNDRAVCESILTTTAWRQQHGLIIPGGSGSGRDGVGSDQPDDDPFEGGGPDVPAGGAAAGCGF